MRRSISYEGQAAIELEMMASALEPATSGYAWTLDGDAAAAAAGVRRGAREWADARAAAAGEPAAPGAGAESGSPAVVRLAPVVDGILGDLEAGAAPGVVGARLHATVADVVLDLCRRVRDAGGPAAVALAGGVFQNRLLAELCERRLEEAGFEVLAAGLVPVNDGGVSLGQAAVAGYTVLARRGQLR